MIPPAYGLESIQSETFPDESNEVACWSWSQTTQWPNRNRQANPPRSANYYIQPISNLADSPSFAHRAADAGEIIVAQQACRYR